MAKCPKYDVEQFKKDLLEVFQCDLQAELDNIMREKEDDIQLTAPNSNAYFNSMSDEVVNKDPFMWYGFSAFKHIQNAPFSATEVTMFFSICFKFTGNDCGADSDDAVLRYIRAMQTILTQNFKKLKDAGTIEITPFAPTDIQINSDSYLYKVGGVEVTGTIKI